MATVTGFTLLATVVHPINTPAHVVVQEGYLIPARLELSVEELKVLYWLVDNSPALDKVDYKEIVVLGTKLGEYLRPMGLAE